MADNDLEHITGETCAMKVYALRVAYVDEKHETCRNCVDDYLKPCYRSIKSTQIPLRQGRLAR